MDAAHYDAFARVLAAEKPDVVFTQWPIDSHRDHRAISLLTLDAWLKAGKSFALYYYEVAEDTAMFTPTEYVDISAVESPAQGGVLRARVAAGGQVVSQAGGDHAVSRFVQRLPAGRGIRAASGK